MYNFKTDQNTFGVQNNQKPAEIGSGLGGGGFGGGFSNSKFELPKDNKKNDPMKVGAFAMNDNKKESSEEEYEEDFELGESIANLGDK